MVIYALSTNREIVKLFSEFGVYKDGCIKKHPAKKEAGVLKVITYIGQDQRYRTFQH